MPRPPVFVALYLAAVLALPVLVHARAVAIVQTVTAPGNTDDHAITISAATTGNVLIALGHILHATNSLTISDSAGSTWNACPAVRAHPTGTIQAGVWWAIAAGATTTVTLTSGSGSNTGGFVLEASGMGTPSCDETGADDDTETSHGAAISVTPSTTRETIVVGAVASSSSATFSATPDGYTAFTSAPMVNAWAGYKLVTSTGANTFASTTSNNESTLTTVAVLMSEASGGSVPCLRGLRGYGC